MAIVNSGSRQPCHFCLLMIIGVPLLSFTSACDSSPRFGHHTADPFLGRVVATRTSMCGTVEDALMSKYRSDTEERLNELAKEMRPTYVALPKTAQGYLGDSATRYLLHRHFLRTRAWLVKGLAPDGGAWNASRPTALLNYSTPGPVRELFEQRLGGRGLDLQEVALLAAMIENQVHQDAVQRLHKAWAALELPSDGFVTSSDVIHVLEAYLMSYIIHHPEALTPQLVHKALAKVPDVYPKWSATQSFIKAALQRSAAAGRREFSFDDAEMAVVEISETYGKFQFDECKELKLDLLSIEGPLPGRVALKDFFWEAAHANKWQFGESVAYMRHVGLLDETDPSNPSIVVPNYIDSPSQFIATSDTFALTCMDECDQVMVQIEDKIGAPYATPDRLASAVSGLATDTQPERPDGFSPTQLLHLEQIAQQDSGRDGTRLVALHGRLFAQWLHHAFPRECPYPHASSEGIELLLPSAFNQLKGDKHAAYASREEKNMYADGPASSQKGLQPRDSDDLPWDPKEELLAPRIVVTPRLRPDFLLPVLQVALVIAFVGMLLQSLSLVQGVSVRGARSKLLKRVSGPNTVVGSKLL